MRKKLFASFLICVMLSVYLCECAPKAEKPTEYIGIVSAMDKEIEFLRKEAVKTHMTAMKTLEIERQIIPAGLSLECWNLWGNRSTHSSFLNSRRLR